IMNLAPAVGTADRELLWKYILTYDPSIAQHSDTESLARNLMECALNFYRDFIEPAKQPYLPTESERIQLRALSEWLAANPNAAADEIERHIYDLGREYYDKPGKIFPPIYRALLGQERGPRLGAFIRLATAAQVARMLNEKIA
ncbi:MAG TPA: hypothetical protein VJ718_03545, partial [Candidatus Binataceae bacterium]|nr:hypothetical protein [Candidatus Binataceae bacterium]